MGHYIYKYTSPSFLNKCRTESPSFVVCSVAVGGQKYLKNK